MEAQPRKSEDRHAAFDRQEKIMQMYSDNAKSYMQLSGLALALTLTFAREILHVPKDTNIADGWMIAMWVFFLTTKGQTKLQATIKERFRRISSSRRR